MVGKVTLYAVRHAQGFHNLCEANHTLPDPSLTELGRTQCVDLSENFPTPGKITHLVASPLRRTIYTCLLSFPSVAADKLVTALPEAQETSALPCDTGSAREKLEAEFNGQRKQVDLTRLTEGWNSKTGRWDANSSAIEARAREARIILRAIGHGALRAGEVNSDGDVEIVLVTHGGFLHYFTEDWAGALGGVGTGWANTEYRSYRFLDGEDASLTETKESRERRKGSEVDLNAAEQRESRAMAEREWGLSGFQTGGDLEVAHL